MAVAIITNWTGPVCKTIDNFNGRFIGGNVTNSWNSCDDTSVVWSDIGAVGSTGWNISAGNTAGFKTLHEWSGSVHRVLRLNNRWIIYGENGIIAAFPEGQYFGFKEILNMGTAGLLYVAGDEQEHICITNDKRVYRVGQDYVPKDLDYREHIGNLTWANIVVCKNPGLKEYFISDGTRGYLLTQWGLCEINQFPTGVFHRTGVNSGSWNTGSKTGFAMETDTIDFRQRGMKTLNAVEVGLSHDTDVQSIVKWKSNFKSSFASAPTQILNAQGVCFPKVTATEFRVRLQSTAYANLNLDYLKFRVNSTDKRYIRGLHDAR